MDISALMQAAGERAPMPFTEVRQLNPNVIAHIDGDYMAYFAAGGENCSAGDARRNVLSRIAKLKAVSGAAKVVMHLTHGASTKGDRFLAATSQPYQGQRNSSRKPINWAFLREWMETYDGDAYTPKLWMTREADDGIAYVSEGVAQHKGVLHVVHTADKDMRMFGGLHVSWNDFLLTEVPLGAYDIVGTDGLQYGHKWFWCQLLQGDTADNIPGLPRVGKETAAKLLDGTTCNADAAPIVYGEYSKRKGDNWRAYFAEQAVLLWMRTDRDAKLLDVLKLGVFGEQMIAAFNKLDAEVAERRRELEALKS
jgi:hypothetical protein